MKRKQFLLLLALLMTAATGAWAQVTHRITATITSPDKSHTGTIDVTLPYTVSIGDAYKAITGNDLPNDIRVVSLYGDGLDVSDFDSSDPWNTTITVTDEGDNTLTIVYNKDGINGNLTATVNISVAPYYSVKLADGTADAANWTIASGEKSATGDAADGLTGLSRGDAVTLSYSGRLKVKAVTATHDGWNGDLSSIPASALEADGRTLIVDNGRTLKGRLDEKYSVVIPDGATVTLAGVTILGTNGGGEAYNHAGITCEGDATIILADNSTNTVKGFHENYPGIYVPEGKKLTIKGGTAGNGKLTASSNGRAAGIGAGISPLSCGNIEIQGGDITAMGGIFSAGIGSGFQASCGTITISGGTVEATGSAYGAGIGSGKDARCGNITITDGVTLVTATKGSDAPYSIGAGDNGSCGTVTIGCTLDTDGNPIGGTVYWQNDAAVDDDAAAYLAQATIVYPNPFALVTPDDIGKMIGSDGKIYDTAADATNAGTTAVAIIVYVGEPGSADASSTIYRGLALSLSDVVTGVGWGDINSDPCLIEYSAEVTDMNGIANTNTLVSHPSEHNHGAAITARRHNGVKHPAGTSEWFLPSAGQWVMMKAAFNLVIDGIDGYTRMSSGPYWSSTEANVENAYCFAPYTAGLAESLTSHTKIDPFVHVRACIAF